MIPQRPSDLLQNKTNVRPVVDRTTQATAQDFIENGLILNNHADILELLQRTNSSQFYGIFSSLAALQSAFPNEVDQNAFAIITLGDGNPIEIAVYTLADGWFIQQRTEQVLYYNSRLNFPITGQESIWYIDKNGSKAYLWYNAQYNDVTGGTMVTSGAPFKRNFLSLVGIDESEDDLTKVAAAIILHAPWFCSAGQKMEFYTVRFIGSGDRYRKDSYLLNMNITSIGEASDLHLDASHIIPLGFTEIMDVENPEELLKVDLGDIGSTALEDVFNLGSLVGVVYEPWKVETILFVTATQLVSGASKLQRYIFNGAPGLYGGEDMSSDPEIREAVASDFHNITDQPTIPATDIQTLQEVIDQSNGESPVLQGDTPLEGQVIGDNNGKLTWVKSQALKAGSQITIIDDKINVSIETHSLSDLETSRNVNRLINGSTINNWLNGKNYLTAMDIANKADKTLLLTAGAGINGGGTLEANRSFSVDFGDVAGKVVQGNDSRLLEAFAKKVNAVSFTGDTNKTLTVTREDGTILTASFLDNNDPSYPDDVINFLEFNLNNDGVLVAITSLGEIISVSLDGRYSLLGHTHTVANITGLQALLDAKALKTTTITAGTGLAGGGSLSANRTISLSQETLDSIAHKPGLQEVAEINNITRLSLKSGTSETSHSYISESVIGNKVEKKESFLDLEGLGHKNDKGELTRYNFPSTTGSIHHIVRSVEEVEADSTGNIALPKVNQVVVRNQNNCYMLGKETGYVIYEGKDISLCESASQEEDGKIITILNNREDFLQINSSTTFLFDVGGSLGVITKLRPFEWVRGQIGSNGTRLKVIERGFINNFDGIFHLFRYGPTYPGTAAYRILDSKPFTLTERSEDYIYEGKATLAVNTLQGTHYGNLRLQMGSGVWNHQLKGVVELNPTNIFLIVNIDYTLEFKDSPRTAYLNGTIFYGDGSKALPTIPINPAARNIGTSNGSLNMSISFLNNVPNSTNTVALQRHSIQRVT